MRQWVNKKKKGNKFSKFTQTFGSIRYMLLRGHNAFNVEHSRGFTDTKNDIMRDFDFSNMRIAPTNLNRCAKFTPKQTISM